MAIHYGAYGVHLGQEDLRHADIEQIHRSGLRLGISTHCEHEIMHTCALKPSYIALGPIFSTTSKIMSFIPHGIEKLRQYRSNLDYPIVAIGGINSTNIDAVVETGVRGIAVISAITKAPNLKAETQKLLAKVNQSNDSNNR